MIGLIDSHIHLDDERFNGDRDQLIQQAEHSGINQFILPAVSAARFNAVKDIAASKPSVKYALGLHPYYIDQHQQSDLSELADELKFAEVIGVGECGLDYYLKDLDKQRQLYFFEAQVELAKAFDLPLILHVRGAVDAVFKVLKKQQYFKAVMHSYNGSIEQTKAIIEAGIYLGFGPAVCNPRATKLKALLEFVPIAHMMLETDAPDQPFYDKSGELNLPVDLLRVNNEIAAIKGMQSDELARQTTINTQHLFNL